MATKAKATTKSRKSTSKKAKRPSGSDRPNQKVKEGGPVKGATIDLRKASMLMALTFQRPGVRRKVDSNSVGTDADSSMIHVAKDIIDSEKLKAIQSFDYRVYAYVRFRTLPFSGLRHGVYLLPDGLVQSLHNYLKERAAEREKMVEEAVEEYPKLVEAAKERLGSLYDPNDYPSAETFRAAFGVSWKFFTMEVSDRLRSIDAEAFDEERAKAEAAWAGAVDEVRSALRVGFAGMVEHMIEILTDKDGKGPRRFKGSTIEKLVTFIDIFDARNITNDKELKKVVAQAKKLLDGVDAESLRITSRTKEAEAEGIIEFRNKLKKDFQKVNKALDPLVGSRPKRGIKVKKAA